MAMLAVFLIFIPFLWVYQPLNDTNDLQTLQDYLPYASLNNMVEIYSPQLISA